MSFDKSYLINPLYKYLLWLFSKIKNQVKYEKLRIGYYSFIRNCTFGRYNWVGENNVLSDSSFNDYTYITTNCTIANCEIGKFCSIGPNVRIAPGTHPTSKFVSTHPVTYSKPFFMLNNFTNTSIFEGNKNVIIGNDVWIGANSLIVDGVEIGDGVIIAANSLVTKNIEPYMIVGGVPARVLKKRFDDKEISKLLELKWWDKDDAWIKLNITKFWDINDFMEFIN